MSTDPLPMFRPLMPRPFSNTFSTHNLNIPAWNQTSSSLSGYGAKRDVSNKVPLVSSRWNPTPEQLQALEEMYRSGIKTPSAQQIQQIAAKLRRFGKIEGKNVFYWFQNHKARERQKKRRQLELLAGENILHNVETPKRRQSGVLSRRYMETNKHPKKLPTPSNCSTASEYSVSMHGEECKQKRWTQMELQQQNITANSTEICWQLNLSSCINNKVTAQKAPGQENEKPFFAINGSKLCTVKNDDFRIIESGIKENQTLQLFPVRSNDLSSIEEQSHDVSSLGTKMAPNQFFEFLPTKN
ncbi:hypothetical protein DH2020_020634 [Rehmannia glutinosa]|uniref:Homeobox domain-containing protein n=1 Tax=Rehmannia glutinosa TaxID=99300 RepID=A0ABR0WHW9_REHGL